MIYKHFPQQYFVRTTYLAIFARNETQSKVDSVEKQKDARYLDSYPEIVS